MGLKSGCLCLLLIFVSAWVDDQQARAHVIALPEGVSSFQQEVFPIATRYRAAIGQQIEMPPTIVAALFSHVELADDPSLCLLSQEEPHPQLITSADLCYVFMSLQC